MKFKEGVSLVGLSPQMISACEVVDEVFSSHDLVCVMTAGKEERPSGLHPKGEAADFRCRHVNPFILPTIRDEIKAKLGKDYDVIVEIFYPDITRTHLHVEFQKK